MFTRGNASPFLFFLGYIRDTEDCSSGQRSGSTLVTDYSLIGFSSPFRSFDGLGVGIMLAFDKS